MSVSSMFFCLIASPVVVVVRCRRRRRRVRNAWCCRHHLSPLPSSFVRRDCPCCCPRRSRRYNTIVRSFDRSFVRSLCPPLRSFLQKGRTSLPQLQLQLQLAHRPPPTAHPLALSLNSLTRCPSASSVRSSFVVRLFVCHHQSVSQNPEPRTLNEARSQKPAEGVRVIRRSQKPEAGRKPEAKPEASQKESQRSPTHPPTHSPTDQSAVVVKRREMRIPFIHSFQETSGRQW